MIDSHHIIMKLDIKRVVHKDFQPKYKNASYYLCLAGLLMIILLSLILLYLIAGKNILQIHHYGR